MKERPQCATAINPAIRVFLAREVISLANGCAPGGGGGERDERDMMDLWI